MQVGLTARCLGINGGSVVHMCAVPLRTQRVCSRAGLGFSGCELYGKGKVHGPQSTATTTLSK